MNPVIQKQAHLVCFGGWGEPTPPPFAYELSGPALAGKAVERGITRYGPKPSSGDVDGRPLALAINGITPSTAGFAALNGAPDLKEIAQPNGKLFAQSVVKFDDAAPRQWRGGQIERDGGLVLDLFVHPRSDNQGAVVTSWRWGAAGAGALFQLRDGKAEFGFCSKEWTAGEYIELVLIYQLSESTGADDERKSKLEAKLFDGFGSINGDFTGLWKFVQIIAEPRGVAHIESAGETTSIENRAKLDDLARIAEAGEGLPPLWVGGEITILTTGQAFYFRPGTPNVAATGTLTFGPFKAANYYSDSLGDLNYGMNSYRLINDDITIEKVERNEIFFDFKVTMNRMSNGASPWLYGISARLAPGPRDGSDEVTFDSDDLYQPVGDGAGTGETDPILEIEPTWDGGSRGTTRRGATVTMRDVLARTTTAGGATVGLPLQCVADLQINGSPFLTGALVTNIRQPNVTAFGRGTTMTRQSADFRAGGDTDLVLTLADGWAILEETLCQSSPVGDGLNLGGYLRELLKIGGFTTAQMAGVGINEGPRLPRGALGEGFAVQAHPDTSVASAINAALDVRGYGLVFYQDRFGVWQLKRPGANPVRAFDGLTATKRDCILQPLDIEHDIQDFYNDFSIAGGKNGEITRNFTSWESIRQPNHPCYLGRKKTLPCVVDSSILTDGGAEYALRSLVWRSGRLGRRGTFETYFHTDFDIGDRLSLDGGKWELLAPSGGSWAGDTMQFLCLEVQ